MPVTRPHTVLCLSGHDPTGGAGIQADIEAAAALGAHALSVITAHTVQDTHNVRRVSAVAPIVLAAQLEALIEDCRIDAIKIGLLGDAAQIDPIEKAILSLRVPVVLDPVLRAGGGKHLVASDLLAQLDRLLPRVDVLTPNAAEARILTGASALDQCAEHLLARGVRHVLITGGDEPGEEVVNTWYTRDRAPRSFTWPRLPETFHGAGCTLASAVAALLAQQRPIAEALFEAQRWTAGTLENAAAIGRGRRVPWRR